MKTAFERQRIVWSDPWVYTACGWGIGLLPLMPGTYGTLIAALFYMVLVKLPSGLYFVVTAAFNIGGVWLCSRANRRLGIEDHPSIVWDEIAAFLIVMIAVPSSRYYLLLGVLLFRLFDVWKPGPIAWVEKHCLGGLGVMLDDILAAIAAWLVLQMLILVHLNL